MVRAAYLTPAVLSATAAATASPIQEAVATAAATASPVQATKFGYQCTDHAFTSSSEDFSSFSTQVVMPPEPAKTKDHVWFDFFVGVKTASSPTPPSILPSGDRSLESSLSWSYSNLGWTLQVCGSGMKDADESGQSCGKSISASSGDIVTLSINHAGGYWTLSATNAATGSQSLRRISEYNAGGGGYNTAFVEMRRVNLESYYANDYPCENLPAGGGLKFKDIVIDGVPGAQWTSTYECHGSCPARADFGSDGTSMQWSWDSNADIVV